MFFFSEDQNKRCNVLLLSCSGALGEWMLGGCSELNTHRYTSFCFIIWLSSGAQENRAIHYWNRLLSFKDLWFACVLLADCRSVEKGPFYFFLLPSPTFATSSRTATPDNESHPLPPHTAFCGKSPCWLTCGVNEKCLWTFFCFSCSLCFNVSEFCCLFCLLQTKVKIRFFFVLRKVSLDVHNSSSVEKSLFSFFRLGCNLSHIECFFFVLWTPLLI